MTMGGPVAVNERATFRWRTERDYAIDDPAQNPYDWSATPTTTVSLEDVQVPVAVEFSARPAASTETTVGQFDHSRAIITILDEDYDLVRGADQVLLGGNTYVIQFVGPPVGLFEVTVYTLYADAVDES